MSKVRSKAAFFVGHVYAGHFPLFALRSRLARALTRLPNGLTQSSKELRRALEKSTGIKITTRTMWRVLRLVQGPSPRPNKVGAVAEALTRIYADREPSLSVAHLRQVLEGKAPTIGSISEATVRRAMKKAWPRSEA